VSATRLPALLTALKSAGVEVTVANTAGGTP
jgi:hypothetical protein